MPHPTLFILSLEFCADFTCLFLDDMSNRFSKVSLALCPDVFLHCCVENMFYCFKSRKSLFVLNEFVALRYHTLFDWPFWHLIISHNWNTKGLFVNHLFSWAKTCCLKRPDDVNRICEYDKYIKIWNSFRIDG